jgi:hypothetical protein
MRQGKKKRNKGQKCFTELRVRKASSNLVLEGVARSLGVTEQHGGVLVEENWVLNIGVA